MVANNYNVDRNNLGINNNKKNLENRTEMKTNYMDTLSAKLMKLHMRWLGYGWEEET